MKSVNTDVAYDYIRKRILNGEYPPGHALMTELLSTEIKVSRTPVRDALRKLETDGLVTIKAHLGASVKKMELKEFREMCDLRLALESHAAGLAAVNHTETDLSEIRYALEAMQRLTDKIIAVPASQERPLINELILEDVRFHIAIMTAAKNDLMKKEILRLHLINRVLSGPSETPAVKKADSDARRREVMAKHTDIYNAIVASDPVAAKREMEFHIQELIDHNLLILTRAESGYIARELTPEELAYRS